MTNAKILKRAKTGEKKHIQFLEQRYLKDVYDTTRIAKTTRFLLKQKGISWSPFKIGYFAGVILSQSKATAEIKAKEK